MKKFLKLFLALFITVILIKLFSPVLAILGWIISVLLGTLAMFAILTYLGKKYNIKIFNE